MSPRAVSFRVTSAAADPHAAVPTLVFRLGITAAAAEVHAMVIRCQIRIEPQRRRYGAEEEARLYELFGETPQWGSSLRPFAWTHATTAAPGFSGSTEVDLPVGCTYDFEVAAAKYMHSLDGGEIPLLLLFSGTVFSRGGEGGFSAEPIGWECQAQFGLPVAVWRDMMDVYFPGGGWIRLRRDTLDSLQRYKVGQAVPTWDQALERLLESAESS